MNILFIVPSYKPAYIYGGPIVSVSKLAEQLAQLGHQVTVYTTTANGEKELDISSDAPVMVNGVAVRYFKRITKDHTHVSPALWRAIWSDAKQYDVVHIHSWWSFLVLGASMILKMKNIKPVLSPRGMLCEYVFTSRNSGKKQLLHKLIGKRLLANTYLHVTSEMEWQECLRLNTDWQGDTIFNLVDLPKNEYQKRENDIFTISFLSRVDPKKGLDILMRALATVKFPYRLCIGGSGDEAYMAQLKQLASDLRIQEKVEWAGWKSGEDKFHFLAEADLFALTSHNENFAMVVIESLCVGTPVLISNNVGLYQYVRERELGWITGIDRIEEIAENLTLAYNSREERRRITKEARGIIHHDFNDSKLAQDYIELYEHCK
jgi:glycosyltransferase involved in cell wall biosynthesis